MTAREIKRCASDFRAGILGGRDSSMMCAVVAYPLQGYLSCLGEQAEIVEVDLGRSNHVFLRLASGKILDPTADQFGDYPKIYVGDPLWFHRAKVSA